MLATRFILPSDFRASLLLRLVLYVVSCLGYWTVKVQYTRFKHSREAAKLGAVLPPRMKGKWPGNVDIVLRSLDILREGYSTEHYQQFLDENGCDTLNLGLWWEDSFVTRNHHTVQMMLATNFDNFMKGPSNLERINGMFGEGIFGTDWPKAKVHRAMTRPFFARERIRDFNIFDHYSEKAIKHFRARAEINQSIDVQDIFGRFTLDAAGEFLFGTNNLNTLDLPLPIPGQSVIGPKGVQVEGDYGGFVHAFESAQIIITKRLAYRSMWPAREFLTDQTMEHKVVVDRWMAPMLQAAIGRKKARGSQKCGDNEGDLIDHLMDSTSNMKLICDELLNILLAARDTTASLLTFTIYMLCMHPEVTTKLRTEVLKHVPNGPPSFEDIRHMKYLRAVLNETLRLFPPVPFNYRATKSPCLVPGDASTHGKPLYIPGGDTGMIFLPLVIQRRKDLWGDDAEEFDPERWIDEERVKRMVADPFKFVPFNAGPRICLGQNYAYNEASFMMVRILQVFSDFTLRQEDAPAGACPPMSWKGAAGRKGIEKIWPQNASTLYSKGGVGPDGNC
ncbi:cytochrome P450 monooxygenase CYP63 [Cantharellus anzutake]|uniref:cytochrome P450 monooxygenase CYP63 n=1 Tax=Cantharellus anzutake TaxID=1750568 RepID=UPI0019035B5A|nr:cytochrome P450 monooxygenase CYP63 [Cantharellus anzutake]KAF8331895.1 cytochrome P450 monooxygenase CYP63 [Cantharellus anzutake]